MSFIILLAFWIILNSSITLEIVLFGILICILTEFFIYKNFKLSIKSELKFIKKLPLIIKYLIILVVEVYKANIDIIKLVLSKEPELKPALMYFTTDLKSKAARVALANSITLTPGTITVTMNDNELLIHAIHVKNLDGIDESIFVEKLRELEE